MLVSRASDGVILHVNELLAEALGLSRERIVGRHTTDFYDPGERSAFLDLISNDGHVRSREIRALKADGTPRWVIVSVQTVVFEGEPALVAGIQDITNRKQVEEAVGASEKKYRELVESINEAIYELDAQGRVAYISPVVEEVSGYSPSEIVGRPAIDFIHPDDVSRAVEGIRRAMSGRPTPNEYRMVSKASEVFWVRSFGRPIFERGHIVGVRGVLTDITERKQVEEALRGSRERLLALLNATTESMMLVDHGGTFAALNTTAAERFGKSVDDLVGINAFALFEPETLKLRKRKFDEVLRTGKPVRFEDERDGRWRDASMYPVFDSQGKVAQIAIFASDITERKLAEEALRESEEKWRSLAENAPDIIMMVDAGSRIRFINRTVPGLTVESVMGASLYDYVQPEHHDAVRMALEGVFETGEPERYEIAGTGPDGRISWYFSRIGPVMRDREVMAAILITTDITGQREAEEALRESEERYRGVVEDTPGLICCFVPGGEITFANKAYCEYFAKTLDELIGANFLSLIPEEDRETVMVNISALTVDSPTQSHEHQVIAPTGDIRWQHWTNRALFDAQGKVIAYQSVGEDITERKLAEEALRESEERYRDLAENLNDAIFELDTSGRLTYVSPGMEKVSGYGASEMIGRPSTDFMHRDDLGSVADRVRERPFGNREPSEYRLLTKSGEVRWVRSLGQAVFKEGHMVSFRGVLTDITEGKLAEEALQAAREELEARVESQMARGNSYGLTFRERQVLNLIAGGKTDREIATLLGLKVATVNKHTENIRYKMNASTRTEAVAKATREGLLNDDQRAGSDWLGGRSRH
jgi:PAS domain S-box-containing protein